MNNYRMTAIIVGVLFILATVAGVISGLSLGDLLKTPLNFALILANQNRVAIGCLFYFIMAVSTPALSIALYPVLGKYDRAWALGYVGARMGEGFFFIIQVVGMLTVYSLSREAISAYSQSLGGMILAAGDWSYLFGGFFFSVSALILNYVLYKTKLVPRWLSVWGLIGTALIYVHDLLLLSGLGQYDIAYLPIAVQEMVFAVWLIVKGFDLSALKAEPA